MPDSVSRFLFEDTDIRGEIVMLETSLGEVLGKHHYPAAVQSLLGEFLAAAVLLSATLKFDGILTLQARGNGAVGLVMAESGSDLTVRAIARDCSAASDGDFRQLLGSGTLAITITPDDGQRYQGIVNLDSDSLAGCIEHYFDQSEQLPTRLFLAADGNHAAGLLVQTLPPQRVTDRVQRRNDFEHIEHLAATVSPAELLTLAPTEVLHRLFHAEAVRLAPPRPVAFGCSCNAERVARALLAIGEAETRSVLDEHGSITVNCEFCDTVYRFERDDVDWVFGGGTSSVLH